MTLIHPKKGIMDISLLLPTLPKLNPMLKHLFILILLTFSIVVSAQSQKKIIDEQVYEDWKSLGSYTFTDDGRFLSFTIDPAKGDGYLYIYHTENGKLDSIPRGEKPVFSANGNFLCFRIKPQYDTLRAMKLRKVRKDKLPKDSLGIYLLEEDSLIKIPNINSYNLPDSINEFVVYETDAPKQRPQVNKEKGWWIFKKKMTEALMGKNIYSGENVVYFDPLRDEKKVFQSIDSYQISQSGSYISLIQNSKKKEKTHAKLRIFTVHTLIDSTIFSDSVQIKNFNFSYNEDKYAFLVSNDTFKENKIYALYYGYIEDPEFPKLLVDSNTRDIPDGYCPSINSQPYYSRDGWKLFYGIAPIPQQEPEDTLLQNEKYAVDIWNWQDGTLQPQQKKELRFDERKTNLCFYHFDMEKSIPIEDDDMRLMSIPHKRNGMVALLRNSKPYHRQRSWGDFLADYYIMNLYDGSKEIVLEAFDGFPRLSADGSFLLYFDRNKQDWFSYDIKARKHINLTEPINAVFYNEDHDMPSKAGNYGFEGWYKKDKFVVLRDRYDLWLIDPTGKLGAQNLTNFYGRNNQIRFNAFPLNFDHRYLNDEETLWLTSFNEKTKESGYYTISSTPSEIANPHKVIESNHRYYMPLKPLNMNIFFWRRMNFADYPELMISDMEFTEIKQISHTNPQQKDYNWGTAELTHWKAFDGTDLEGLIYKPEDFDSSKKYPMIVYFYERYADNLHLHYVPKPSHSTINFTEYVSNGYVVFVPDIRYKTGHPAKSAYNCIVSGTKHMMQFPWIDSTKMALQGQSWGGYQTAMLVTMTDLYACAEAGAPVSNMTSAYGGIRWGSGMSRAFQYEKSQSRIGYSLWDSTQLYIENSPIFFADRVNTPLLIMHNDKDGAVPWYQGIEFFNGLRRLDKPVWMLTYNNDGHNLMKWPNRVDLSIRMRQFFDHYLKDAPMPKWMSEGVPALDKGKVTGYELEEK